MLKPCSLVASLLLGLSLSVPLHAGEADLDPQLRKMIEWLPADSETLLVAQGEFAFTIPEEPADGDERGLRLHQTLQQISTGHLHVLDIAELNKGLQGVKVELAIQGSRRFTSARGLGAWMYEGCQIIQFHESAKGAITKAFDACQADASETVEVSGQTVAVFERRFEEADWMFYLCHPQPGLLVCATNRRYLAEVLARINQPAETRAFPKDLAEWGHVDVKAPVWALRHYRMDRAKEDPSAPFGSDPNDPTADPGVIGVTFWFDEVANSAKVRYLSKSKAAVEIVSAGWNRPSDELVPKIKTIEPGVVEITSDLPTTESVSSFLFNLMGYLGHGVNL